MAMVRLWPELGSLNYNSLYSFKYIINKFDFKREGKASGIL